MFKYREEIDLEIVIIMRWNVLLLQPTDKEVSALVLVRDSDLWLFLFLHFISYV